MPLKALGYLLPQLRLCLLLRLLTPLQPRTCPSLSCNLGAAWPTALGRNTAVGSRIGGEAGAAGLAANTAGDSRHTLSREDNSLVICSGGPRRDGSGVELAYIPQELYSIYYCRIYIPCMRAKAMDPVCLHDAARSTELFCAALVNGPWVMQRYHQLRMQRQSFWKSLEIFAMKPVLKSLPSLPPGFLPLSLNGITRWRHMILSVTSMVILGVAARVWLCFDMGMS